MSSPLALHGGTPVLDLPDPDVPWPPIDSETAATVAAQLYHAVSVQDRSDVIAVLEERLADYFEVRHAILTSSGTAALFSAYNGLGLAEGHEVIVPANAFHALATPLLHLRVKPVLVDCDASGHPDPGEVEAAISPATGAVAVAHGWGGPADVEPLAGIAARHGAALVEDGSHAHGATVDGRKIGTFGRVAAFSMNGSQPLSAGEGGFVLTDDDEVHHRVLLYGQYGARCRAEIPIGHPLRRFAATGMGLKLRMHPLAAALALNQLDGLDNRLAVRRRIADRLIPAMRAMPGLTVVEVPPGCEGSCHSLALIYRPEELDGVPIDSLVAAVRAEGCAAEQPGSPRPLNEHPLFEGPTPLFPLLPDGWPRYRPGQFRHAEHLHRHTIKLTVPHEQRLADAYVAAWDKVITQRRYLF